MTRYRWGSRAILQNSAASSLNFGLLSASIIQPEEEEQEYGAGEGCEGGRRERRDKHTVHFTLNLSLCEISQKNYV